MGEPTKRIIHTPWFDVEVDVKAYDTMCQDLAFFNKQTPQEALEHLHAGLAGESTALAALGRMDFKPFRAALPGSKQADGVFWYPGYRRPISIERW